MKRSNNGNDNLPAFARVVRGLPGGEHPYTALLPLVHESPAMRRIESPSVPFPVLVAAAKVRIQRGDGYVWVDHETPAIVLIERYYHRGSPRDLYLDLLHELAHLRQIAEGRDVWDRRFRYVDRPTEIEGYAVAVEEGLRLGMTDADILQHLSNPWMSHDEVIVLHGNVKRLIANWQTSGRTDPSHPSDGL